MIGVQVYHALKISKFIKQINPNIPIVWGGVQPTLTPSILIKNKYVDLIVKGEGEVTFAELIDCLKNKDDFNKIKGIFFKNNNQIIETGERKLINLSEYPPLPYQLVDMKRYLPKYKNESTFYFQTSRGCPNKCSYCYNLPFNRQSWRALSAEKVVERIKEIIIKYQVNHFYFIDDNFLVDINRAKKFTALIIKEKLNIRWQVQGITIESMLEVDENFLSQLEKSGLVRITIGLETGSLKILKFLKKNFTIENAIEVNRKLAKFNIIIFYSMICGFYQESDNDLRQSIELVLKILKENPNARISPFYAFTPFPGTELYEIYNSKGLINKNQISSWIISNYDNINAPYINKKRTKLLNSLIFVSFFIDKKFTEYSFSRFNVIIRTILSFYRLIARFRIKFLKFNFLLEKFLFDHLIRRIFM